MMHGEVRTNMSVQQQKLTEIADAIRAKKGTSDPIVANDFATEITNLPSGGSGGMIDDFYKEQSQGYYNMMAKDIIESQNAWATSGINVDTDTNYSKLPKTVAFVPELKLPITKYADLFSFWSNLKCVPNIKFKTGESVMSNYGSNMFNACSSLVYVPDNINYDMFATFLNFFYKCVSLKSLKMDFSGNNFGKSMNNMFGYCESLEYVELNNLTNITSCSNMFNYCKRLVSGPQIDTRNSTTCSRMFSECESLTSTSQYDLYSCTDANRMYYSSPKNKNIDLVNTSKVSNWEFFASFQSIESVKTLDLTSLKSNSYFFGDSSSYQPTSKCHTLFIVPNTINVTIFFNFCTGLSQESIDSIVAGCNTVSTTKTITFANIHKPSSTNAIKLTDEQVTAMQAKGWTVAFK